MYYSLNKILSHDRMINIVTGMRGCGKTYATLCFIYNRFKKYGEQYVHLRRTLDETQKALPRTFDALLHDDVITDGLDIVGNQTFINGIEFGYHYSLNKYQSMKSLPFPKVGTIILEEFIAERGSRYLKYEPDRLISIMESVFRMRKGRVIMLGNMATQENPYFLAWGIEYAPGSQFTKHPNGQIILENVRADEYVATKAETAIAKIIADTQYGDFMLNNQAFLSKTSFIEKAPSNAQYIATMVCNEVPIGIRKHDKKYYFGQPDLTNSAKVTTDKESHSAEVELINKRSLMIKYLYGAHCSGNCRYLNHNIAYLIKEAITN